MIEWLWLCTQNLSDRGSALSAASFSTTSAASGIVAKPIFALHLEPVGQPHFVGAISANRWMLRSRYWSVRVALSECVSTLPLKFTEFYGCSTQVVYIVLNLDTKIIDSEKYQKPKFFSVYHRFRYSG